MAQSSILSVAVANLNKSHDFLMKLLDACDKLPSAPGTTSDQEMVVAVTRLAQATKAIIRAAERGGSDFVASQALAEATLSTRPSSAENDARRLRIVLEMCLQQADQYRQQAITLQTEAAALRRELRLIEADLVAMKTILARLPAQVTPHLTLRPTE